MIRILHCLNLLWPGGVERRRLSIFKNLPRGKYQHRIICVEILDDDFADKIRSLGVEIVETGQVRSVINPRRYVQAAKIIRRWKPHICHGAVIEGYVLAAISGTLAGGCRIILEETSSPIARSWRGTLLAGLAGYLSDQCVATSNAVAAYLSGPARINKSKIQVIYNGAEIPDLAGLKKSRARNSLGLPNDAFVIGSVGRVVRDKGFDVLIRALALLVVKNYYLLIVGDGPEIASLRSLAQSLGVADRVIWAGRQDNVGRYYLAMDIFALASRQEAFGMVNVEAMGCGLPVIATNVGGVPEVVINGETGILVDVDDVVGIVRAIEAVKNDDTTRRKFSDAGRKRAQENFSVDGYVKKIDALYTDLVRK